MTLTIQQLDQLVEKFASKPVPPKSEVIVEGTDRGQKRPLIDAKTARQQVVGMQKWVVWMSGGEMRDDVAANELLVEQIEEREAQLAAKDAIITRYEKALDNIYALLEMYADNPFELRPVSKWNKGQLAQRILIMVENISWVATRVENELRPECAVPLMPGPKD